MLSETINRDDTGKGYRFHAAQELFRYYASLNTVEFHVRGDGDRTQARPGVAVYFLSTHTQSKSVRVHESDKRAAETARKQARSEAGWTPELRALASELAQGNCYRLSVREEGYAARLALTENLHDIGGSMTYVDGCNGCILRTVEDVRRMLNVASHDAIYHPDRKEYAL